MKTPRVTGLPLHGSQSAAEMFVFPSPWFSSLLEMDGVMWQKEWDAKCNPEVWQGLNREGQDLLWEDLHRELFQGRCRFVMALTLLHKNTGQERWACVSQRYLV